VLVEEFEFRCTDILQSNVALLFQLATPIVPRDISLIQSIAHYKSIEIGPPSFPAVTSVISFSSANEQDANETGCRTDRHSINAKLDTTIFIDERFADEGIMTEIRRCVHGVAFEKNINYLHVNSVLTLPFYRLKNYIDTLS